MRLATRFPLLSVLALLALPAPPARAQAVSRAELIAALKAGRDAQQLAAEAKQHGVDFFAGEEDEAALKAAGATPALLAELRSAYRPSGPPVSQSDLLLVLKLRPPRERLERLIESRGVDFAISPQAGAEIMAAGGDSALVGLIALNKRLPPEPPPPPAPVIPPLPPNPVAFQRISPYDAAAPAGVCDLRVRVDQDVEFFLRGEEIAYEVRRGAPPVPADSSCNQPLPQATVRVAVRKVRGRGKVTLLQQPSEDNHFTTKLLVEDPGGGSDLFHIRLSWTR